MCITDLPLVLAPKGRRNREMLGEGETGRKSESLMGREEREIEEETDGEGYQVIGEKQEGELKRRGEKHERREQTRQGRIRRAEGKLISAEGKANGPERKEGGRRGTQREKERECRPRSKVGRGEAGKRQ